MNTDNTGATWPTLVISKKILKIYRGKHGIIIRSISLVIITLNSFIPRFKDSPLQSAIPNPKINESINETVDEIKLDQLVEESKRARENHKADDCQ
jgi:hypothetical protein